jgi:tRNA 2-thiouridine synthesizing protein A
MSNVVLLDATGLNCPLPILRAKKALKDMKEGQFLEVITTDPGSVKDFESFCNTTRNKLESYGHQNGQFKFTIKKT